jgi:hypothetical protein
MTETILSFDDRKTCLLFRIFDAANGGTRLMIDKSDEDRHTGVPLFDMVVEEDKNQLVDKLVLAIRGLNP